MSNNNSAKTSVSVTVGLANAYGKVGKDMKREVLAIRPSYLTDSALRKLFNKYGIKVHGNKKWFLNNFEEILQSLPNNVDTFVESYMGSGVVALEAYKQSRFKRIITNDIYWHKANYLRAFFFTSDALKIIIFLKSTKKPVHSEIYPSEWTGYYTFLY